MTNLLITKNNSTILLTGGDAERDNTVFGPGTGMIWLDNVDCAGTEDTLLDCPANNWGENNCSDGHNEDIGVICTGRNSPK